VSAIVIILSSSKEEADISTAYRLGANAYLVKPTDTRRLQVIAKSIKDFWLTQNTPPPEPHEKEAAPGLPNGSRREALGLVRQ
jgi:DNA-binding response OmpR family regulator